MTRPGVVAPGSIAIIDIEASCLPALGRSYPIEIAVGHPDSGRVMSWLIRPEPDWLGWAWDPAAERLHGLTMARLQAEGLPRVEVARAVEMALSERHGVSDAPAFDQAWMELILARPVARLAEIEMLLALIARRDDKGRELRQLAKRHADAATPLSHRAAADVSHHLARLRYVSDRLP
jgi:hypothetical protein